MTIDDLYRKFPTDAAAAWFAAQRWPEGVHCPRCHSANVLTSARHATMPYRCRDCDKRFSVKTGTVMACSNLGYRHGRSRSGC